MRTNSAYAKHYLFIVQTGGSFAFVFKIVQPFNLSLESALVPCEIYTNLIHRIILATLCHQGQFYPGQV